MPVLSTRAARPGRRRLPCARVPARGEGRTPPSNGTGRAVCRVPRGPFEQVCGTIRARWLPADPCSPRCAACCLLAGTLVLAQNPRDRHTPGREAFTARRGHGPREPMRGHLGPRRPSLGHRAQGLPRDGHRPVHRRKADGAHAGRHYQSVVQDGLMGMAFHPEFLRGKGLAHVFLAYTYDKDPGPAVERRMRVSRFSYDVRRQVLTTQYLQVRRYGRRGPRRVERQLADAWSPAGCDERRSCPCVITGRTSRTGRTVPRAPRSHGPHGRGSRPPVCVE